MIALYLLRALLRNPFLFNTVFKPLKYPKNPLENAIKTKKRYSIRHITRGFQYNIRLTPHSLKCTLL